MIGAVVPHAPLLLPEVVAADGTAPVREAMRSIDLRDADLIVIAAPHGRSTGIYTRTTGNLDAFGPRGIDVAKPTDAVFAQTLARSWGGRLLDAALDHGAVVPLRLLETRGAPVVAVAFREGALPVEEARRLARAVTAAADGRRIAFVASANTSAGLSERAPLPSLEGAAAVDRCVLRALRERPGDLPACADDLVRAGSCGAGPLAAFGFLFPEEKCSVAAYERPFGVGYAVAVTT